MRLSEKQKQHVLRACEVIRPGATLRRVAGGWVAVWFVHRDNLLGDVKVPVAARWRAQLVVRVDLDGTVWWSGEEHRAATRSAVVKAAAAEAEAFA